MPRPFWMVPLYEPLSVSLGGFVVLTNIGTAYRIIAAVRLDFTNVVNVSFTCRYNKVGTGTLSWQIWNATDATEMAIINDAVAGDNKQQTINQAVSGLVGFKELLLRVKSTTAADDPVHYASDLVLT